MVIVKFAGRQQWYSVTRSALSRLMITNFVFFPAAESVILRGSFSAVSTSILQVNTKYSLESSWRDLQDLHTSAPLRPQNFSENASNRFAMSKIQLNFVKHFRIFQASFSKFRSFFAILSKISQNLTKKFRNFSKFAGKDQNLLDSQISWDFAPKIVEIFREWLSKS